VGSYSFKNDGNLERGRLQRNIIALICFKDHES